MFSLLVHGKDGAWEEFDCRLEIDRFLMFTNEDIKAGLKSFDPVALKTLCSLPTLFMYEERVGKPGFLGRITDGYSTERYVDFSFDIDRGFQPISWDELKKKRVALRMAPNEPHWTHWAVKPAPLLEVLRALRVEKGGPVEAPAASPVVVPSKTIKEGPTAGVTAPARSELFISYSHKDKKWLNRLQTYLKPAIQNRALKVWSDADIDPGDDWKQEIEDALARAKVAVLLVSADYLASDFILNTELPMLAAAAQNGLKILWVLVTACAYDETEIPKFQAVLPLTKPLKGQHHAHVDKAFVTIAAEVKKALEGG
ncbi:MAG TPA: toll/interleukin-1 receptor domain-containing protein [Myxococcaceae bacterium]|nr:toll/interleukin-1 receptor domain-containing protein [Myxococcaceae bacterium]